MRDQVEALIRSGGDAEAMALALYAWQVEHIPAYRRFADGASPRHWTEIPAVPAALFQDVIFCAAASPGVVFRTSGTTTGRRGVHAMPDAAVYDLAARAWFERLLPDCPIDNTVSLVTNPAEHPDSSLGHMVGCFAPRARWFFSPQRGLDAAGAWAALREAREPIWLPATAFALADLFDAEGEAELPAGSVVMVTGGFKGRRGEVQPTALALAARRRLGEAARLVGEYGMTELSSQLWDLGDGFQPPPWLLVNTIDPVSGAPTPGVGLLRFVDLANWGSCLAVETQDLGEVVQGRVSLRGRLAGAPPRGCSLSVEEARR